MESTGESNKVQISGDTERTLRHTGAKYFSISPRGDVEVKGKGKMKTFFVETK